MKNQAKPANPDGVMHVTRVGGSVFEDLGFGKQASKGMQEKVNREIEQRNNIKRAMVDGLTREIARRGLSAMEAANMLDISRPRLSDITHFKVEKFSIDAMSDLMTRLGQSVQVVIAGSPSAARPARKAEMSE
ncbi:helix-turn-helix domain-containing protein [Massilia rubra]|nr:XRE family transcriptional regulator [Massilia rubra]